MSFRHRLQSATKKYNHDFNEKAKQHFIEMKPKIKELLLLRAEGGGTCVRSEEVRSLVDPKYIYMVSDDLHHFLIKELGLSREKFSQDYSWHDE